MIAEAVVSFIIEKIGELLVDEGVFLHEVRGQVEWVEAELRSMRAFLKDADTKQKDERVKNWVADVRDAAYNAEDVIDNFVLKIEQGRRRGLVGFIKRFAPFSDEPIARRQLGKDIQEIKNKLLEISRRRLAYGIKDLGEGGEGSNSIGESLREQRRTSPLLEETEIVGFQEDIKTLMGRLIEGELRRCVISVVGMGGLGKTTLTRKVYNNTNVKKHFNCCAWIYVSQEYVVRDLLLSIMRCFIIPTKKELEMDDVQLRERLFEYLKKKRYFVVVDDIWKTDAWNALAAAFPDMKNGSQSCLPLGTETASHADAQSRTHELQLLREDESWELFCKKTFSEQDTQCPQHLEALGRQIVAKCHGLPLAVDVIAGLLSRKAGLPNEWEKVLRSISWQFVEGDAQISRILALSYEDLPYYLKSCFLYLGVFPEDYEISARKLIRLWVAEGFIQSRGAKTLEDVAEDWLEELIHRSLIQLMKRSSIGGVKSCCIHDLLRDLSISKAKEENFLQGDNNSLSPCKARRLIVHHDISKYTSLNQSTPHLRSILCFTPDYEILGKHQQNFIYGVFHLLRVLHLHQIGVEEFPNEIGTLIHLRYLGLTGCVTGLKTLPSSIANLCNLQTLELESNPIDIPSDIWKIQQLRHVRVNGRIIGGPKAGEFSCSSNLQSLATIQAGDWIDDYLGKLTNLRKLGIWGLNLSRHGKGLSDSLPRLDHLCSLKLKWGGRSRIPVLMPSSHQLHLYKLWLHGRLEEPPKSHEFSPNLTKITLEGSYLHEDPMMTLEKLTSLRILILNWRSYEGKEMVCSSQGFPRLEYLRVQSLRNLEEWRVEEGAMPSLLHLHLNQCGRLKKLPEGLQYVTTLGKLTLQDMPQELKARLQEEEGEDWHKIQHIPSINIDE